MRHLVITSIISTNQTKDTTNCLPLYQIRGRQKRGYECTKLHGFKIRIITYQIGGLQNNCVYVPKERASKTRVRMYQTTRFQNTYKYVPNWRASK